MASSQLTSHLRVFLMCMLVCRAIATPVDQGQRWSYHDRASWPRQFPQCAEVVNQSPINLSFTNADLWFDESSLEAGYPDVLENTTLDFIERNGGGIELVPEHRESCTLDIHGGNNTLSGPFKLKQIHLHSPSEHAINSRKFPAEMHFVHSNSAEDPFFTTLAEAISNAHGRNLSALNFPLTGLKSMFGHSGFFRYVGSLTTPPCTPGVLWTVLPLPLYVTAQTLASLRGVLQTADTSRAVNSFDVEDKWAPDTTNSARVNGSSSV